MPEVKQCSNCKWWSPKYYNTGICQREGRMLSKFWIIDGKDGVLLTAPSFYCNEYEPVPDTQKDTL